MVDTGPDEESSFGFNTEVSHRDRTYHVQTESMDDPATPTINTLVYHRGALVWKASNSYADLAPAERSGATLLERVRRQHLKVVRQIKSGELTGSWSG